TDGELLWRFFKTMDDGIMSSTDDLIERMMRKVSRNFPYASKHLSFFNKRCHLIW
ncbi:MAG: hypothetical protein H7096_11945, partial [Flavobacterium sp.]|nr:hypothetical protein [Pedobacter sp.]